MIFTITINNNDYGKRKNKLLEVYDLTQLCRETENIHELYKDFFLRIVLVLSPLPYKL